MSGGMTAWIEASDIASACSQDLELLAEILDDVGRDRDVADTAAELAPLLSAEAIDLVSALAAAIAVQS